MAPDLERLGFIARGADADEAPAIARVVDAAFSAWPPVETDVPLLDHLTWKISPPDMPSRHHTVVTHDGKVVAAKLRWVARAWLNGVEYLNDSAADFAVDPAYQGQGLGRLIVDYDETGDRRRGAIGLNLPSNNEIVQRYLSAEGKIYRLLNIWTRPLTSRRFVSAQLHGGGVSGLARGALRAVLGRRAQRAFSSEAAVVTLDQFDERADALWLAARDQFQFSRIRDAAYLNWRHADRRSGRRTILGAIDAAELRAYAVLRPTGRTLELVDLLVHPEHPGAGAAVLQRAVDLSREQGANAIDTWLPPAHPDEALIAATGFVRSRDSVVSEFFAPRGSISPPEVLQQLADPTLQIHITMGDFDFH